MRVNRTSAEWARRYKDYFEIVSKNGWEQENNWTDAVPYADGDGGGWAPRGWYKERITKREFLIRVSKSTCRFNKRMLTLLSKMFPE